MAQQLPHPPLLPTSSVAVVKFISFHISLRVFAFPDIGGNSPPQMRRGQIQLRPEDKSGVVQQVRASPAIAKPASQPPHRKPPLLTLLDGAQAVSSYPCGQEESCHKTPLLSCPELIEGIKEGDSQIAVPT